MKFKGNPRQEQTKGKLFADSGLFVEPVVGDYYLSFVDGVACLCENDDFPMGHRRHILKPYISFKDKLTQWADRHINWPAVGFWIVILFCAAFWYGACRLIWWVWYCL
jgi:hypothetical protein